MSRGIESIAKLKFSLWDVSEIAYFASVFIVSLLGVGGEPARNK